jgi:hypothetical protein
MVFISDVERKPGFIHVLLVLVTTNNITTGSVASVKAPLIVEELLAVCGYSSLLFSLPLLDVLDLTK